MRGQQLDLNFAESHPDSVWSYQMLAVTIKPTDKSTEPSPTTASVELHPEDMWAKQQIEALSKITIAQGAVTHARRTGGAYFRAILESICT